MTHTHNDVAVVILNYNGEQHLKQFLPSVVRFSSGARVIVADNGSSDNSMQVLAGFPSIEIIDLQENYGFCGGYNRALAQVKSKYYVLLNSDVEVTENWLTPLYSLLEQNREAAAVQPKIKAFHQKTHFEYAGAAGGFIDSLGYPFSRGRLFDTLEKDEGQYNDAMPIFWATGACMMIRSSLYHEMGGLDEDFFAHMEEIDLCWRLKRAGYQIYYTGESEVYHVGGGTLHKSNPRKTYLNFRNSIFLLVKNLPMGKAAFAVFMRLLLDGIAALRFLALGEFGDFNAVFKAHLSFYRLLFKMLGKRKTYPFDSKTFSEMYTGSIVWDYFVSKKAEYRQLNLR